MSLFQNCSLHPRRKRDEGTLTGAATVLEKVDRELLNVGPNLGAHFIRRQPCDLLPHAMVEFLADPFGEAFADLGMAFYIESLPESNTDEGAPHIKPGAG